MTYYRKLGLWLCKCFRRDKQSHRNTPSLENMKRGKNTSSQEGKITAIVSRHLIFPVLYTTRHDSLHHTLRHSIWDHFISERTGKSFSRQIKVGDFVCISLRSNSHWMTWQESKQPFLNLIAGNSNSSWMSEQQTERLPRLQQVLGQYAAPPGIRHGSHVARHQYSSLPFRIQEFFQGSIQIQLILILVLSAHRSARSYSSRLAVSFWRSHVDLLQLFIREEELEAESRNRPEECEEAHWPWLSQSSLVTPTYSAVTINNLIRF